MGTVTHKNEKYITFKREEFFQMMGQLALPPWAAPDGTLVGTDWDCAPIAQQIEALADEVSLDDAVVIRRQDLFASPVPRHLRQHDQHGGEEPRRPRGRQGTADDR